MKAMQINAGWTILGQMGPGQLGTKDKWVPSKWRRGQIKGAWSKLALGEMNIWDKWVSGKWVFGENIYLAEVGTNSLIVNNEANFFIN